MIQFMKRLVRACRFTGEASPKPIRRKSLSFREGGAVPTRDYDTAEHRRHHHYYEDLLT